MQQTIHISISTVNLIVSVEIDPHNFEKDVDAILGTIVEEFWDVEYFLVLCHMWTSVVKTGNQTYILQNFYCDQILETLFNAAFSCFYQVDILHGCASYLS